MRNLTDYIKESASLFDIYKSDEELEEEANSYYIYALDRKGSYLDPIFKTRDRKKLISKLQDLEKGKFHKTWAKKYQLVQDLGELVGGRYPNYKEYTVPFVELNITHGDANWSTDIELIYDIEHKKLYYYEGPSIMYHGIDNLKLKKQWDGKLSFRRKR